MDIQAMECMKCQDLKKRIAELEKELSELKLHKLRESNQKLSVSSNHFPFKKCNLSNKDIQRYSRQIILPEIAVNGQYKLQASSVLVVGAGGLGCPAAMYLAAAGIGCIGLVDHDVADLSNLHRQVLHKEDTIGKEKVDSAIAELKRLNSSVKFNRYHIVLSSGNVLDVIKEHDIVLDCTDNVATRYLLNDACVFAKKTLISGSALRFEGQLTVYNHKNGPCYRCLYPSPPPAETVTNCSDGGVIGAVTGVIGSLQALEAVKIITGNECSYAGKMLLYDGLNGTFRNIKLRERKPNCVVCGDNSSVTVLQDYEQFCGSTASDKEHSVHLLEKDKRITVQDYATLMKAGGEHLLVDVRPKIEFEICSLTNSINVPIEDVLRMRDLHDVEEAVRKKLPVYIACKRGNDSQKAVLKILDYVKTRGISDKVTVKDIIGGLSSWSRNVEPNFPTY
ncbi:adenylyltransferase and sulfurtransferase MOCS3-like [Hydractinia symbiolongicarpus]|uniref:adenylyltransferase and sulfurtransferase MOCS3-like n=1 Tax=Hydractinia symbiolongicarpus TaxID=13093 RepID=UPI002550A8CE|nr:adenylyltransferase and sulfurtransferase MOCS3-like [Hydractinia symbiolongicarpus]